MVLGNGFIADTGILIRLSGLSKVFLRNDFIGEKFFHPFILFSGFLSDLMSYRIFFLAVMLATIPAFVITRLVPFTYDDKPNDK